MNIYHDEERGFRFLEGAPFSGADVRTRGIWLVIGPRGRANERSPISQLFLKKLSAAIIAREQVFAARLPANSQVAECAFWYRAVNELGLLEREPSFHGYGAARDWRNSDPTDPLSPCEHRRHRCRCDEAGCKKSLLPAEGQRIAGGYIEASLWPCDSPDGVGVEAEGGRVCVSLGHNAPYVDCSQRVALEAVARIAKATRGGGYSADLDVFELEFIIDEVKALVLWLRQSVVFKCDE